MFKCLLLIAVFYAANAQVCPPGLELEACFSPPCLTERCPRFPNAVCTNDFCGGCNAIFTDPSTGRVIPRFACETNSNFPDCLNSILCPVPRLTCGTGCPRVPDAVCNLTCDCSLQFTDRRTGSVLSAEECGRDFDERCPPTRFQGFGSCNVCPRKCSENEICCPNGCFGNPLGSSCVSVQATCPSLNGRGFRFTCTDGNTEGSNCQLSCGSDEFLIGTRNIVCQSDGQWSDNVDDIRCIREREFDSRCPIVQPIRPANCPVCPTNCPPGQICCPNGCPGSSNCIPVPTPPPTTTRRTSLPVPSVPNLTCAKPVKPRMRYDCRINNAFGIYFCSLSCTDNYRMIGPRPSRVVCFGGQFSPSMNLFRCEKMSSGTYRSCTRCGR